MKNTFIFWGIIVLVAVIGFTMTACGGGGGGDDGGGGNAFLGAKLEISGEQVYTEEYGEDFFSTNYKPYTGSASFSTYIEGSGAITGGKLTYTIGTPSPGSLYTISDVVDDFSVYWDNVTISDTTVKVYALSLYTTDYDNVYKANTTTTVKTSGNTMTMSGTDETVGYYYVDKDVTISGKGKTTTEEDENFKVTFKTNNFNLSLKQGWNAVYEKTTGSGTMTATNETYNETMSVSLSNPNLKWVIDDYSSSWSVLGPSKAFKRLQSIGK